MFRGRTRFKSFTSIVIIAAISTLLTVSPPLNFLKGISLDLLFGGTSILGENHDRSIDAPISIIALDETTYRTPPFAGTPKVFWTPHIARVIGGLLDAKARVIGLDFIFPTTIDKFVPRHEREFLRVLRRGAKDGRIVLAKVQHGREPIVPFRGQSFAVYGSKNIRAANLVSDPDEIVRRSPLFFDKKGLEEKKEIKEPSFSLEIAARAIGKEPALLLREQLRVGRRGLSDSIENTILLNFGSGSQAIRAHSIEDIHRCITEGNTDFLRKKFQGKVVLLGTWLDIEDRLSTSNRYATKPDKLSFGKRCTEGHPEYAAVSGSTRPTVPGVLVQATAVSNILLQEYLIEPNGTTIFGICFAFAVYIGLIAGFVRPIVAAIASIASMLGFFALGVNGLSSFYVLPFLQAVIASLITFTGILGYRFVITEKSQRNLRSNFKFYLSPVVVDELVKSERPPKLGGEEREITVLFSDLAGFTKFSEKYDPQELVLLLNKYLSAMTNIIEEHGGFVDKYIGDAIVAVFGAPLEIESHSKDAVAAAIGCRKRLKELNFNADFGSLQLMARIGINTGKALVGNIGSERRFNYTVIGDVVNTASRLEGANKAFGTEILLSETTKKLVDEQILCRKVDKIQVVGKENPISIYEPVGAKVDIPLQTREICRTYELALAAWYNGEFSVVRDLLQAVHEEDDLSKRLHEKASYLSENPPADGWSPINILTDK
ncbi:MAG: Adenylate cyclase 1 [Alphaproteobacteria bacterium MarineAlpha11_Bin1]|nr:MAG: Adenylate cyclase 1 [Alphaproteobacteria bacterium MarineAlpha11_Bin1]|tara:strand:+ start:1268 stop:3418 length:2151 start_codon:yes stop_codon:yes gene_type:complete